MAPLRARCFRVAHEGDVNTTWIQRGKNAGLAMHVERLFTNPTCKLLYLVVLPYHDYPTRSRLRQALANVRFHGPCQRYQR